MRVSKCDLCHKEIKQYDQKVSAGLGSALMAKELCLTCGKPVIKFLLQKKLVSAKEVEKLKK